MRVTERYCQQVVSGEWGWFTSVHGIGGNPSRRQAAAAPECSEMFTAGSNGCRGRL